LTDLVKANLEGDKIPTEEKQPALLARQRSEQEIGGFCRSIFLEMKIIHNIRTGSLACFILAAGNFPDAMQSAWGHTREDMTEESWVMMNNALSHSKIPLKNALGLLVKMTRSRDLGGALSSK
jgi:hypothetical protein